MGFLNSFDLGVAQCSLLVLARQRSLPSSRRMRPLAVAAMVKTWRVSVLVWPKIWAQSDLINTSMPGYLVWKSNF
jgi:hypothetical protein